MASAAWWAWSAPASSPRTSAWSSASTETFLYHLLALVIVAVFSFVGSLILYKVTDLIIPLRVTEEQEHEGLDLSQHGETALAVGAITNGNGHKNGVHSEPMVGVHA